MKTVKAIHTISGQVATLPVKLVNHPILGKYLTEVDDDAKSYAPELYKPKDAEEFAEKPRRSRKSDSDVTDAAPEASVASIFDSPIVEEN